MESFDGTEKAENKKSGPAFWFNQNEIGSRVSG